MCFYAVGANGSGKSNFFHGEFRPLDHHHYFPFFTHLLLLYAKKASTVSIINDFLVLDAAIRFVLSDIFQNLRNEDRHALLHVCSHV